MSIRRARSGFVRATSGDRRFAGPRRRRGGEQNGDHNVDRPNRRREGCSSAMDHDPASEVQIGSAPVAGCRRESCPPGSLSSPLWRFRETDSSASGGRTLVGYVAASRQLMKPEIILPNSSKRSRNSRCAGSWMSWLAWPVRAAARAPESSRGRSRGSGRGRAL